jgi:hypothetical protein
VWMALVLSLKDILKARANSLPLQTPVRVTSSAQTSGSGRGAVGLMPDQSKAPQVQLVHRVLLVLTVLRDQKATRAQRVLTGQSVPQARKVTQVTQVQQAPLAQMAR